MATSWEFRPPAIPASDSPIGVTPRWKMEAASAASACPSRKTSTKCSGRSRSSRSDHRDVYRAHHGPSQFAIKAATGSVPVNRGQQYFARSALLRLSGPFHGVAPGRVPASGGFDSERNVITIAVADAQRINGDESPPESRSDARFV